MQGLQVFNETGKIILNVTDRISKVLGSFYIDVVLTPYDSSHTYTKEISLPVNSVTEENFWLVSKKITGRIGGNFQFRSVVKDDTLVLTITTDSNSSYVNQRWKFIYGIF